MPELPDLLEELALTAETGLGLTQELRLPLRFARLPQASLLTLLWDDLRRQTLAALRPARSGEPSALRPGLVTVFRLAAELDEAYAALSRALPSAAPPGATAALRAEVEHLVQLTVALGKAAAALFGRREALLIVAPAFQSQAGL